MQKKYMGRNHPPATLVSLHKAAATLGVSPETVLTWGVRGLLEQVWDGNRSQYREEQVLGLVPLIANAGPGDLAMIAARADHAYATSRNVEVRLNALLDLLGLNRNVLDMRQFAVIELHQRVDDALLEAEPPSLEEVRFWAGTFFSIDEAYLCSVEKYVATDEPWKKFLDLGYKLVVDAPHYRFNDDPELRAAYGYLKAARAQLRTACYFYCRERHGPRATDRIFEKQGAITERIMGLLYPH